MKNLPIENKSCPKGTKVTQSEQKLPKMDKSCPKWTKVNKKDKSCQNGLTATDLSSLHKVSDEKAAWHFRLEGRLWATWSRAGVRLLLRSEVSPEKIEAFIWLFHGTAESQARWVCCNTNIKYPYLSLVWWWRPEQVWKGCCLRWQLCHAPVKTEVSDYTLIWL